MWRLITTPVWHSVPYILLKQDAVPAWRCYSNFATTPDSAFASVGYSLTMEPVIAQNASRSSVVVWDCTHHKPMARQSASFRPPCVSGPMHGAMTRQSNGQNTCNRGCMSTTGTVLMTVWASSPHQSSSIFEQPGGFTHLGRFCNFLRGYGIAVALMKRPCHQRTAHPNHDS